MKRWHKDALRAGQRGVQALEQIADQLERLNDNLEADNVRLYEAAQKANEDNDND